MLRQFDTLNKVLFWGTLLPLVVAIFSPLFLSGQFLFPFITVKVIFFRILVEVSLFFYILLVFRCPEFRPRYNILNLTVFIFVSVITVVSIFGVDLYRSFWGNIERGEGLLTLYHLFALFLILSNILRTKKYWKNIFHIVVFVSVLSSVYALFQLLGFSFVIHGGQNRLSSTIGNPAFFAGYLIFGIYLAAYMYKQVKPKLFKVYYLAVILFQIFILIRTETRGSLLGLIGGLLVALVISVFLSKDKKIRVMVVVSLITVVVFGSGIWLFRESEPVKKVAVVNRLATISLTDITTESRLYTWDSSWRGFKDRPLLGYGWENYSVAFNKYFHAEIFRDHGSQIWFDRAHNIVFDILVTSGILGLASYLSIFIAILLVLWKFLKKENDVFTFALIIGLYVAYFIQNLFVFDVLATYLSLFIILSFTVFLSRDDLDKDQVKNISFDMSVVGRVVGGIILLFLLGLSIFEFNIKPLRVNKMGVDALILSARGKKGDATKVFEKAIAMGTNQTVEIRQKYAELVLEMNRINPSDSNIDKLFIHSISEIKNSIKEHPRDVQNYLFLMVLYNASDRFDKTRIDYLLEAGEKALELSPTRPQIYYEIGQAQLSRGKYDEGVQAFKMALELQPEVFESGWNLALAYAMAGKDEALVKQIEELEKRGFNVRTKQNLRSLSLIYFEVKNYTKLVEVHEELVELSPNDATAWVRLGSAYQTVGDLKKAKDAIEMAVELDSSLSEQAKVFMNNLSL